MHRLALCGVALLILLTGLLYYLHGFSKATPSSLNDSELQAMHAICVAQMIRGTCMAMTRHTTPKQMNLSTPVVPSQNNLIFIAGLGAVDAQAYAALRESGEAMCSVALRSCQTNPLSNTCRTAQGLWRAATS